MAFTLLDIENGEIRSLIKGVFCTEEAVQEAQRPLSGHLLQAVLFGCRLVHL